MKLQDAGCEIARVAVQGKNQAYALEKIKNILLKKGYIIPIVADVHFYPAAAEIAADFVEKIRINPGNFVEKRASFKNCNFTDIEYQNELNKAEEKLFFLIEKLKKNKVALRIGVNHGSLSDRITSLWGNTIEGMIILAIEYAQICRKFNFHNLVFSMKSSSAFFTIEAYRMLVKKMISLNWNYPLHLGVTEAGDEEDGIIKSSIGIGSLLLDGIGDTIRVSLTGDPVKEIKAAKYLIALCKDKVKKEKDRKKAICTTKLKSKKPFFSAIIYKEIKDIDISLIDVFYLQIEDLQLIKKLKKLNKIIISKRNFADARRIYSLNELLKNKTTDEIKNPYVLEVLSTDDYKKIKSLKPFMIIYKPLDAYVENIRNFYKFLNENNLNVLVVAHLKYDESDLYNLKILAASEIGLILYDKIVDSVLLDTKFDSLNVCLDIFQACNLKRHKTEYIACPGCGRTLFDIQTVLRKIKEKTSHLKVKIAVMGCIVNGPGEMQDADFGYVGSAQGKVDLYENKKCVEKNIDEKEAADKLMDLIMKRKALN